MKYIIKLMLCLAVPLAALHGCMGDQADTGGPREGEMPVTITLGAPLTRSGAEGSEVDYEIDMFRVMGFRTGDGSLAFNEPVVFSGGSGTGSAAKRKATVNVLTGSFTIVFIANEQLDNAVTGALAAMQPDAATLDDLAELSFDLGALAWKSGNSNLVPMAEVCPRVLITGDDKLTYGGDTVDGQEWNVTITRMAVRVGLTLNLTSAQLADFDHIRFKNVPKNLYIIPRENASATEADLRFLAAASNGAYTLAPGNVAASADPDYDGAVVYPRLLLPETLFSPVTDKDKAVELAAVIDGEAYPGRIGVDMPDDYTLPRNLFYDITATVDPGVAELEMIMEVEEWDNKLADDMQGERQLRVSVIEASINERNMARIWFWTNRKDVSISPETSAGADVDDIFYGLVGTDPANFHYDASTGEGWFDIMTDREKPGVTAGGSYTHALVLDAGGLRREITVNITIPSSDFAAYDYVGAFWRHDQKGERVIAMANSGDWTATVEGNPGWVVLAPGKSLDANLWVNGKEPGDAENYPVEGSATTVSGTGNIYLRIGLTGENPKWDTPRYAKVVVNGTHAIYLRQGEAPDYVMRPEDPATTWTGSGRPLSVKMSPFNLTSPEFMDGTKTGGTNLSDHSILPVRGGVFTEYPTQAGAYFQWATQEDNYAFHPANPSGTTQISGWPRSTSWPYFWDTYGQTRENCPEGYRRPVDGPTTAVTGSNQQIPESEIRQSLWYNPENYFVTNTDNIIRGYYADGFFDRRVIVNSTDPGASFAACAVSVTDHKAAYVGYLVFNPLNSASIFFPAAGNRSYTAGILSNGSGSVFYTASKYSTSSAATTFTFNPTYSYMYLYYDINYGYTIRCVVEEP